MIRNQENYHGWTFFSWLGVILDLENARAIGFLLPQVLTGTNVIPLSALGRSVYGLMVERIHGLCLCSRGVVICMKACSHTGWSSLLSKLSSVLYLVGYLLI